MTLFLQRPLDMILRWRLALAIVVAALLVGACAAPPGAHDSRVGSRSAGLVAPAPAMAASSEHQRIGRPYYIEGIRYTPHRDDTYRQVGMASWYGPKYDGNPTANGERFDQHKLSAAHPTLPLPSLVRVTNLENGKALIVRVNDRGPFIGNRIIDLSLGAARALGLEHQGLGKVEVAYVGPAREEDRAAPPVGQGRSFQAPREFSVASRGVRPSEARGPNPRAGSQRVFIQAAAFHDRGRARASVHQLRAAGRARIETVEVNGRPFHRVMVGPFRTSSAADDARVRVASLGYNDAKIVSQ